MKKNNKQQKIHNLESLAQNILSFKQEQGLRRPIIIEFCGSPKSGKTSCINALNIFLKRNDFKTIILTERAGVCPIKLKTHPYFNIWTSCSVITEILKNISSGTDEVDIILADRAIFDALCWFEWQNTNPSLENPYLRDEDYKALRNFLTIDMFVNYFDLIYIFKADPTTSLEREYANLLTEKRGSIMNEDLLGSYLKSLEDARTKNETFFRKIEVIDTSKLDQDSVNLTVTETTLEILVNMLIEKVGYFDSSTRNSLSEGINNFEKIAQSNMLFDDRSIVEDANFVQPIPIAVITNKEKNRVLVLKKNSNRLTTDSPEKDKLLLYVGGHIRQEDGDNGSKNLLQTIKSAIQREIQEELSESIGIKDIKPFLIFTPSTSTKSSRHLAVCFVIEMDLTNKKFNPTQIEFVQKSGKTKSGHILSISELNKMKDMEFDSWSIEILKHVFGLSKKQISQICLFSESEPPIN